MQKTEPKQQKKGYPEIERAICDFIHSGIPNTSLWTKAPKPKWQLKVVAGRAPLGNILGVVSDNTYQPSSVVHLAGLIYEYLWSLPKSFKEYQLCSKQCIEIAKTLALMPPHFEKLPKALGFKSDPEMVITRLDYDPIDCDMWDLDTHAPVFAEMLSRVTNYEAIMWRLGSLFDENAHRKQVIWLYGEGDGGKSIYTYLLKNMFKDVVPISPEVAKDKFWKQLLIGRRLAVCNEAATEFLKSGAFKSLTGDTDHIINGKFEKAFAAELSMCLFFISNEAPEVPKDSALLNRIIPCRVTVIDADKKRDENYIKGILLKEIPWIAGAASRFYKSQCPGVAFETDKREMEQIMLNHDADILDMIEEKYIRDPEGWVTRTDFWNYVASKNINFLKMQHTIKTTIKSYLQGVEKKLTMRNDKGEVIGRRMVFMGIRQRNSNEIILPSALKNEEDNLYTIHKNAVISTKREKA